MGVLKLRVESGDMGCMYMYVCVYLKVIMFLSLEMWLERESNNNNGMEEKRKMNNK